MIFKKNKLIYKNLRRQKIVFYWT